MSVKIREFNEYFIFAPDVLPLGIEIPCQVYFREDNDLKVFLKKGERFSLDLKNTHKEKNITELYINISDKKIFQNFLLEVNPKKYFDNILDRYTINNEYYYKIEKECIDSQFPITFSLYVNDGKSLNLLIEASKENPKNITKERIVEGDILISKKDIPLYNEYLQNFLKNSEIKPQILKETTKILLREIFSEPTNRRNLIVLEHQINEIINFAALDSKILDKLLILKK